MPSISEIQTTSVFVGVAFIKDEDYIVANCPALELSSYGKTEEEARKRFAEALSIFIEETTRMGTLHEVLTKLGWTLTVRSIVPPSRPNKELYDLFQSGSVLALRPQSVELPLSAVSN